MQSIKHYSVVKISDSSKKRINLECNDAVVTEEPLEVWVSVHPKVSTKRLFTTMRTPGDDINLVKGWLYSSGIIYCSTHITSINHSGIGRLKSQSTNRVHVNLALGVNVDFTAYQRVEFMHSACGVCGQQSIEHLLDKLPQAFRGASPTSLLGINAIRSLIEQLREKQFIFNQTGGIHGVALFDQQLNVVDTREDVGRHNALDKIIGANMDALTGDKQNKDAMLGMVFTSRASFELLQKAAMVNIRSVIAMGAPTSLAIELARDCDICLIGFVKVSDVSIEFNVYSRSDLLS